MKGQGLDFLEGRLSCSVTITHIEIFGLNQLARILFTIISGDDVRSFKLEKFLESGITECKDYLKLLPLVQFPMTGSKILLFTNIRDKCISWNKHSSSASTKMATIYNLINPWLVKVVYITFRIQATVWKLLSLYNLKTTFEACIISFSRRCEPW